MCLATACLVLSLHTRSEAKTKSKAKKSNEQDTFHTIRKCKKMAGQNTFPILLLNDDIMIGEH